MEINLILFLLCIKVILAQVEYKELLEWGKENGIIINDKISMKYISENTNYYYANSDISEGEIIMNIPYKTFLSLNNTLNLSNKKIKSFWNNITNLDLPEVESDHRYNNHRKEETFLSIIQWLFTSHKKYHESKFYKFYKYFFATIRTNYDSCPIFFNQEQKDLFSNTSFGTNIDLLEKYIDDDLETITPQTHTSIEREDFIKFRLNFLTHSFEVLNESVLIPFTNLFERNPFNYNVKYKFNEEKMTMELFTSKNIKKDQNLILYTKPQSNLYFLLFSGITYDDNELTNNFILPILTPTILDEYELDIEEYDTDFRINITEDKYYEKAIDLYKDMSKKSKGKGTDREGYSILLALLNDYKNSYEYTTVSDYYKLFYQKKDIENVKNVVELEKKIIKKKIKELEEIIKNLPPDPIIDDNEKEKENDNKGKEKEDKNDNNENEENEDKKNEKDNDNKKEDENKEKINDL